jgi:hypothetical protein
VADHVWQTETHTAVILPEPGVSENDAAIGNVKTYELLGLDKISAQLTQAGRETFRFDIHKLIKLNWNKQKLPHQ